MGTWLGQTNLFRCSFAQLLCCNKQSFPKSLHNSQKQLDLTTPISNKVKYFHMISISHYRYNAYIRLIVMVPIIRPLAEFRQAYNFEICTFNCWSQPEKKHDNGKPIKYIIHWKHTEATVFSCTLPASYGIFANRIIRCRQLTGAGNLDQVPQKLYQQTVALSTTTPHTLSTHFLSLFLPQLPLPMAPNGQKH